MTAPSPGNRRNNSRSAVIHTGGGTSMLLGLAGALAMTGVTFTLGFHVGAFAIIHGLTLVALGFALRSDLAHYRDASTTWLALITAFAIGPLGAVGVGLVALVMRHQRRDTALLDDWYERISLATQEDPITRLCDDVSVGRTMNLRDAAPHSFHATVKGGALADRQSVLGLIARRFNPQYLPVLREALISPQPVVRVQAAAVAAHVRQTLAEDFRACLAEVPSAAESPERALTLLSRMDLAIASGLLDAGDEKRGALFAERLSDVIASSINHTFPTSLLKFLSQSRESTTTFERLLLSRRRFAELRMLRSSLLAIQFRPRARVRRLAPVPFLPGAAE